MATEAGTKLGRDEIRSQLGAGGMGEVYLAQETNNQTDAAAHQPLKEAEVVLTSCRQIEAFICRPSKRKLEAAAYRLFKYSNNAFLSSAEKLVP